MTMTDPIADLLTRIRNINRLGRYRATVPYSKLKEQILATLKREGFIEEYTIDGEIPAKSMEVTLKYGPHEEPVISAIERVSKPGCRVYSGVKGLTPVLKGMGINILSTPKGILSDREARKENVGGEILCRVY